MREPLIKLTQLLSVEAATAQGHGGQVTIDTVQVWDRSVRLKFFLFYFSPGDCALPFQTNGTVASTERSEDPAKSIG